MSDNDKNDDQDIDIDIDEFDDGDFDDFEGGDSLGEVSRDNPLVKIGLVIGAFAAIVGGLMLFGGESEEARRSVHAGRSQVAEAPGGEVTESYREAQEEENVRRVEEAIQQRGSAMPTPTTSARSEISLQEDDGAGAEDPLERWRRIQEERQRKEQELPPAAERESDPHVETVEALSNAMMQQMNAVLETKAYRHMAYEEIAQMESEEAGEEEGGGDGDGDGAGEEEQVATILLPAGEIEYGQLMIEANTDAPGPVLAQVASGPLAGSKLIGSFEAKDNYLILSFDTIVIDGISHSVDAVALDPDTTLPGMATEIDRRYLSRYVLPAAAAFVAGLGSAVAETGSTVVATASSTTVSEEEPDFEQEVFKGIEDMASKVEEMVDERTSTIQPMIRVAPGTPLGIFFVGPVLQEQG